jgi:hypothetical protein
MESCLKPRPGWSVATLERPDAWSIASTNASAGWRPRVASPWSRSQVPSYFRMDWMFDISCGVDRKSLFAAGTLPR